MLVDFRDIPVRICSLNHVVRVATLYMHTKAFTVLILTYRSQGCFFHLAELTGLLGRKPKGTFIMIETKTGYRRRQLHDLLQDMADRLCTSLTDSSRQGNWLDMLIRYPPFYRLNRIKWVKMLKRWF